jgi:uncharacterized membrane protein YoaK (UPF0700 family)
VTALSPHSRDTLRAGTLTVIAGIADAVGYLTMGGVFAANMTGNTVLAGIAAAQHRFADAWQYLAPLGAFFLGCMVSRLLLRTSDNPRAGLLIEAALLAVTEFLPLGQESAVLIVALAMGIQASAITQFAGHSVSTVVVTSTLARTADTVLDWLLPRKAPSSTSAAGLRLLVLTWLGYLVGAVAACCCSAPCPIRCWSRPRWSCCRSSCDYIGGASPSLP